MFDGQQLNIMESETNPQPIVQDVIFLSLYVVLTGGLFLIPPNHFELESKTKKCLRKYYCISCGFKFQIPFRVR